MENEIEVREEVTAAKLKADLVSVIRDSENILKGVLANTNQRVSDLYECLSTKLYDEKTNPWITVGIFMGIGLAIGWVVRQRSTRT